jgi:hypothetical protein
MLQNKACDQMTPYLVVTVGVAVVGRGRVLGHHPMGRGHAYHPTIM